MIKVFEAPWMINFQIIIDRYRLKLSIRSVPEGVSSDRGTACTVHCIVLSNLGFTGIICIHPICPQLASIPRPLLFIGKFHVGRSGAVSLTLGSRTHLSGST
jgi:hypothetical protein